MIKNRAKLLRRSAKSRNRGPSFILPQRESSPPSGFAPHIQPIHLQINHHPLQISSTPNTPPEGEIWREAEAKRKRKAPRPIITEISPTHCRTPPPSSQSQKAGHHTLTQAESTGLTPKKKKSTAGHRRHNCGVPNHPLPVCQTRAPEPAVTPRETLSLNHSKPVSYAPSLNNHDRSAPLRPPRTVLFVAGDFCSIGSPSHGHLEPLG